MKFSDLPTETTITDSDYAICNASVAGTETTIKILWSDLITALSLGGGGGSGAVVAVKQVQKTDTFTSSATTPTDVTGLSITYTPTSATNKILVSAFVHGMGTSGTTAIFGRLIRDSTPIGIGDLVGSHPQATTYNYTPDVSSLSVMAMQWLDSPATTSATTYKFQVWSQGSGTLYVNRTQADSSSQAHVVSTITIMEVTP